MKVAVMILLVAVGACSAAFSGSLVQKTQPLINQAGLRASIAVSSLSRTHDDKDFGNLIQTVINNAIASANSLISQVELAVGQPVSGLTTLLKIKIRAAIVAIRQVVNQIKDDADVAAQNAKASLLALIARLEGFLNRNSGEVAESRGLLDGLVGQLNIGNLLQNGLHNALSQLINTPLVQNLIQQLLPFLDQAGDMIDQITNLLLGQVQLSRAAPKFVNETVAYIQNLLQAIKDAAGDAIVAAQNLVANAVAQSQQTLHEAAQNIIGQLQAFQNVPLLGHAVQGLIEALQSLVANE